MSTADIPGQDEPMTLPADIARCPGYWADNELREGCEDCQRRTDRSAGQFASWVKPPEVIFIECELRIPPCSS